jgi:AraC-like DNA-binding protein
MDFISVFLFLGVIQALFLGVILIIKGNSNNSLGIGGVLLMVIGILCLDVFLEHSGLILNAIYLYNFSQPAIFLIGPLFYFWFYRSIQLRPPKFRAFHLIPFFLYLGYYFYFYLQPNYFKKVVYSWNRWPELGRETVVIQFNPDPLGINEYFVVICAFSLLIYWLLSVRLGFLIRKEASKEIKNQLVIVMLAVYGFLIFLYLFSRFYFTRDLGDFIPMIFLNAIVYFVSGILITQSDILKKNPFKENEKYKKSTLPKEIKDKICRQIVDALEQDKMFCQQNLSLTMIANEIGAKPHHVSQVINESMGTNFFKLLAKSRIEEACRLLSDMNTNTMSIQDLAFQVGYNSKSAFIKAFKSQTGTTPSVYRKNSILD